MEGKTLSILLVENNSTDAELIRKLLNEYDEQKFNLTQVQNIESALEILAKNNFDVMLLDLAFSEEESKSSLDTLDTVKQQVPQLPIIVITATESLEQALQVILQGAQNCLIKPELEAKTLCRSLQYAIARQQAEFNHRQQALMKKMLDQIRDSMDLESILQTTGTVIQQFVRSDQVLIYRCESPPLTETTVVAQSVDAQFDQLAIEQFINAVNFSSLQGILSESTSVQAVEDTLAVSPGELQVIEPQFVRSYLILPIWLEESIDESDEHLTFATVKHSSGEAQNPKLWGMLVAYNARETRRWQDWEISFLQRLTTQVTVAIRQSQLCCRLQTANQKLQKLAILDGLTGIANRRYFDLVLDKEWQRLAREQQPLSLILCDIDYFKAYNDTYGHQQGDRCLQKVAQILQQSTRRPADLVARYGGEEFALILPNTNAPGALFLAHRIVRQLTQQGLPHSQSQVSKVVTLSIGIATKVPHRMHPSSTIIETADNLLYKAKQAGRNQYA
ncbi:MAG: diguanylate cyclase [Hydrococcus sp. SU_1_0]|nr:diguanylate cyclase [Hydrococcus sp. SU_1_0]